MRSKFVLTFHGVGEPGVNIAPDERPYWLSTEYFYEIVEMIKQYRHRVEITFDDGNLSDYDVALPVLKRAGLCAQFFIVTDRIGRTNYLSSEHIKTLHSEGMSIGTHGAEHVNWTTLSNLELVDQVSDSLLKLRSIICEDVRAAAVPFGAYDWRVLAVLKKLRVPRVYTSDRGLAISNSWIVPRNSLRRDIPLAVIEKDILSCNSRASIGKALLRRYKAYILRQI